MQTSLGKVHWMSRRLRPHYRSDLGWILGVAFVGTLTRSARPVQGFTFVRCCGSPRASSPHGLTAPGMASHDGTLCVQLPPARGCYQLAPRRTFTSNPVPMPGTPTPHAARTLLDPTCASRHPGVQVGAEEWSLGLTKECRSTPRHMIGKI